MKGTLLVEADLDEALVDDFLSDAVTAGSDMITISFTAQAHRRMAESQPDAPEEMVRTNEAKLARDDAVRRAHEQSAPRSMRKRGAAGFELCRNDPGFTGDWYAYKRRKLDQAQTRVLSDADLQDLLRWSASTGKPLNLRGCNLSEPSFETRRFACLSGVYQRYRSGYPWRGSGRG